MEGYDPIELSKKIREIAVQGEKRKYYRFREAKFYGGIATADCVGCNLSCHFCWSKKPRKQPQNVGKFYSAEEVKEKLVEIAEENKFDMARVSGNEPTIGKEHLIRLLEEISNTDLNFILETNGILIGKDDKFASELRNFGNLHVRVSLKGCDQEQFKKLTGCGGKGFDLQIKSLKNLTKHKISCHAALIKDFTTQKKIEQLRRTLSKIDRDLIADLEFEKLILYPHVKKQLKKADIEIPK